MRLPLLWLHDHVDPGLSAEALAERLAMTGTEVDRVHRHGVAALEHFRIGKVLSAERHPDADRLTVCTVDLGDGEPHQIVCGAPNVAAGQTVAVASPGAIMPDGTKLKKAKLRGQESRGMILAEDEVGIGGDHDGIMVLPEELEAGSPSPTSTVQTVSRSASGWRSALSTFPIRKCSSASTPCRCTRSTSVPVIASRVASSSADRPGSV